MSAKVVFAVGVALLVFYSANFVYAISTEQSGGTFGDTFGVVNALFSGSALFFLVLAFISQREELELVKQERNDTRKLMQGQEAINEQQKFALQKQSFEQSFFSLVRLISEERRELDRPLKPDSKNTIAQAAAYSVKWCINRNGSLLEWELDDEVTEFGTTSRLLITAYGLLEEQDFDRQASLFYASTLHALIDSDFAHVFLALTARWHTGDPRALQTFQGLQIQEFLDEQFKPFAEEVLT